MMVMAWDARCRVAVWIFFENVMGTHMELAACVVIISNYPHHLLMSISNDLCVDLASLNHWKG
jgi:hypothetical protein